MPLAGQEVGVRYVDFWKTGFQKILRKCKMTSIKNTLRPIYQSGYRKWIALGLLNIVFLVYALVWSSRSSQQNILGTRIPVSSFIDIDGRNIELKNTWTVILFSSVESANSLVMARYAATLVDAYTPSKISIISIMNGNHKQLEDFRKRASVNYPLIADTPEIRRRFGFSNDSTFHVLINPEKRIKFASQMMEPEDLRQLLEKNVRGRISYRDFRQTEKLMVGAKLSPFEVRTLATDTVSSLALPRSRTVIFFTAACPECSLEGYMKSYREFELRIPSHGEQPLLVFSSRFRPMDLKVQSINSKVRSQIFQATGDIPLIEDTIALKVFVPYDIVALQTDDTGSIRRIQEWAELIKEVAR